MMRMLTLVDLRVRALDLGNESDFKFKIKNKK
jgi:hypothetical protein